MTQEQAISYAIEHEGIDVITEPIFVNYLNDLQTLSKPAINHIILQLMKKDCFAFLKALDDN